MSGRRDHPCFSCTLPDCDETDSRCNLKRANRRYANALQRGDDVSLLRAGHNAWFAEFHEDRRRARDGRAPRDIVKRAGSIQPPGKRLMTRPRITVTNHAVLRFLERAHNLQVERLRTRIADIGADEAAQGARIVTHGGVQLVIEGDRVVTVLAAGMRPKGQKPQRRKGPGKRRAKR